jgi:hypothetical protein
MHIMHNIHMQAHCGLLCVPCVGLAFSLWLRFALRSLALWRVGAIAPSFVSGWRASSSISLCVTSIHMHALSYRLRSGLFRSYAEQSNWVSAFCFGLAPPSGRTCVTSDRLHCTSLWPGSDTRCLTPVQLCSPFRSEESKHTPSQSLFTHH